MQTSRLNQPAQLALPCKWLKDKSLIFSKKKKIASDRKKGKNRDEKGKSLFLAQLVTMHIQSNLESNRS